MKHDYEKLKNEFMNSNITLMELSKRHGVAKSQLYRVAQREDWVAERERERIKEGSIEECIRRAKESDDEGLAERLQVYSQIQLELLKALFKHCKNASVLDIKDFYVIIKALKEMKEMGFFGSTVYEKKILAEIERINKDIQSVDTAQEVKVIIEGAEEYGD